MDNPIFLLTTLGKTSDAPEKDYTIVGDQTTRVFGIFNAMSIIATTYGNGIIPEIQVSFSWFLYK